MQIDVHVIISNNQMTASFSQTKKVHTSNLLPLYKTITLWLFPKFKHTKLRIQCYFQFKKLSFLFSQLVCFRILIVSSVYVHWLLPIPFRQELTGKIHWTYKCFWFCISSLNVYNVSKSQVLPTFCHWQLSLSSGIQTHYERDHISGNKILLQCHNTSDSVISLRYSGEYGRKRLDFLQ
jgi:hypothetical protein